MGVRTVFRVQEAHIVINGKVVSSSKCSRFFRTIQSALKWNNELATDSKFQAESVFTDSEGNLVYIKFKDGRKREFLYNGKVYSFARFLVAHIFMGGFMGNARKNSQPVSTEQGNLTFL